MAHLRNWCLVCAVNRPWAERQHWGVERTQISRCIICCLLSPMLTVHWHTNVAVKIHSTNYSPTETCMAWFNGVLLAVWKACLKRYVRLLCYYCYCFSSSPHCCYHITVSRGISVTLCRHSLRRAEVGAWVIRAWLLSWLLALLFPIKAQWSKTWYLWHCESAVRKIFNSLSYYK